MPRGVYPRTKNQLRAAKKNLAKGRTKEVREKANRTLRQTYADPEVRDRVSEATRKAMWRPEVRAKHLAGLKRALEKHGPNFRGGNGQPLTKVIREAAVVLEPLGFIREYPIKTKGHGTGLHPPRSYKADFANPETMVAIEFDGPSHRSREARDRDEKKTKVLEALGWEVIRVPH